MQKLLHIWLLSSLLFQLVWMDRSHDHVTEERKIASKEEVDVVFNTKIKPKIFLLGVQKGGSDSLFEFLMQHKDLCSPWFQNGRIKNSHP